MTTKVQQWGNSLALRIPKSFAKDVHLSKGASVDLSVDGGRLVIRPSRPTGEFLRQIKFSVQDWQAFLDKAEKEPVTTVKGVKAALKHLDRLKKK